MTGLGIRLSIKSFLILQASLLKSDYDDNIIFALGIRSSSLKEGHVVSKNGGVNIISGTYGSTRTIPNSIYSALNNLPT